MPERLSARSKHPLLLVAAVFGSVLLGAYAAQHYAWEVVSRIEPLTESFTVSIATSGATYRDYYLARETFAHVLRPGVFTLFIDLVDAQEAALAEAFDDLSVRVEVEGVDEHVFQIVKDGIVYDPLSSTFSLPAGRYGVEIEVAHWTKPVAEVEQDSFSINVYLVLVES